MYICDVCNYKTNKHGNLIRHNDSKSHKIRESHMRKDINILNKYQCKCGKSFNYGSAFSRHKKTCKIVNKDKISNNNIAELRDTIDKLAQINQAQQNKLDMIVEEQQKTINTIIEQNKKQIEELVNYIKTTVKKPTIINDNKTINTFTTISAKKYIQQNYANAPALKKLPNYGVLENYNPFLEYDNKTQISNNLVEYSDNDELSSNDDSIDNSDVSDELSSEEDFKFLEILVNNYKSKRLCQYLGDFLIKYYKKQDPQEQSLWNSDTSRLTYFIKQLLNDNASSMWIMDKKGVMLTNTIIVPLLKYIKTYIEQFIECSVKLGRIHQNSRIQRKIMKLGCILQDIENKEIANGITKYIAPHFCLTLET